MASASSKSILSPFHWSLVSGTVRWPDGQPADGVELKALVMVGGQGVTLEKVKTDNNGTYQLQFPKNADSATINCLGLADKNSIWHFADPINDLDASQKSRQILGLKKLTKSLAEADWLLVAKKKTKLVSTKVTVKSRNADNALSEISARYYRTPWAERNHKAVIEELLDLEKKYRGETAALNALRLVMDWTSDLPDKSSVAAHAMAVHSLSMHYLSHPHLDSVMPHLSYQFRLNESVDFLKLIQKESPHAQVKASALLFQSRFLAEQIESWRLLAQNNWKVEGFDEIPKDRQLALKQLIADMRKLDPAASRKQIAELVAELKKAYGKLKSQQFISNIQSFRQRRYRLESMESFSDLADRVLFRVMKLRPGQVIEDFVGKDVNGKKFKLSDFRGKVVLLMFSADWCGPCKQAYPENREFVKKYKGRAFQLISVMADRKAETVARAKADGEITWLTTWDGERGPIATKWNISTLPTFFIVDHTGVIRSTNSTSKSRSAMIEKLVMQAEKKK